MTERQEEGVQVMTIRVPKVMHKWLRQTAFERGVGVSMNDLVNEALTIYAAATIRAEQEGVPVEEIMARPPEGRQPGQDQR